MGWSAPRSLAFHGADHDAGDEVALDEGIDDQDREGGDHDGRGAHRAISDREGFAAAGGLHQVFVGDAGDEEVAQVDLERVQGFRADVHHRVKIAVPVAHRIEEHHRGKRRLAQGNHDAKQHRQIVRAVQLRRFDQGFGDRLEGRADDNHVVGGDRRGQDQRPHRVHQAELLHRQIHRHHAAGEKQRRRHHRRKEFAGAEALSRQGIGAQRAHHDVHKGADHRVQHGIAHVNHDVALEDRLVGRQRHIDRHDAHHAAHDVHAMAERGDQRQVQGIQRHQHQQKQNAVVDDLKRRSGRPAFRNSPCPVGALLNSRHCAHPLTTARSRSRAGRWRW